jgi:hypothetical protein
MVHEQRSEQVQADAAPRDGENETEHTVTRRQYVQLGTAAVAGALGTGVAHGTVTAQETAQFATDFSEYAQ